MGDERPEEPAAPHAQVEALTCVTETMADIAEVVRAHVRDVPDFPMAGVLFKDLTPLLADGPAFESVVEDMASRCAGRVDVVVGIEARGFILGAALAHRLGLGFVPVRKSGKLPGPSLREAYTLEYGEAVLEVHAGALLPGQLVVVVDDVLATGGTVAATRRLVERAGAVVAGVEVVLELTFLGGRARAGDEDLHAILAT